MSSKQTSKRNSRKSIMRNFETHFDLARLDYKRRVKPSKDISKVMGLMFAAIIYLSGFGLAYYSWSQQLIDDVFLNKISWIFMIPASVVGLFAFLITSNRREFPIREDIRAHVAEFEGGEGYLWRYGPILLQLEPKKIDMEGLIEASREGRLIKMAPEDICGSIHALYATLHGYSGQASAKAINEVEKNLLNDPAKAA